LRGVSPDPEPSGSGFFLQRGAAPELGQDLGGAFARRTIGTHPVPRKALLTERWHADTLLPHAGCAGSTSVKP